MNGTRRRDEERLDAGWDAVVVGGSPGAAVEGPDLDAVRALHRRHAPPQLTPEARERIRRTLLRQAVSSPSVDAAPRPRWSLRPNRHESGRNAAWGAGWIAASLPTAALLTVVVLVGTALRLAAPPPDPVFDLLMATIPDGEAVVALDPVTLADRPGEAGIVLSEAERGWPHALSADGSTFVTVIGDLPGSAAVVRDAHSGRERTRFATPWVAELAAISRDGTRLVVGDANGGFHLVDTADGHLVATTQIESPSNVWDSNYTIDAAAERLYLITPQDQPGAGGPTSEADLTVRTPSLIVYDLSTGGVVDRLPLPRMTAGQWWRDESRTVAGEVWPGLAVSPDGRTVAIVHGDRDAVRLVDAERMVATADVPFSREPALLDHLRRLVPFPPGDASAAVLLEGPTRKAVFAPDGETWLVFGFETVRGEFAGEIAQIERGLGLLMVDALTGEVLAEGMTGELFDRIVPAPNGQALYTVGPIGGEFVRAWSYGDPDPTYVIRRLDAETLSSEAERAVDEFPQIFVRSPGENQGHSPGAGRT